MTTNDIIAQEEAFQIPTYKKVPVAIVKGDGPYVWDADGQRHLDFYGGHCVTILGHCPPKVVQAIQQQAGQMMFYSNIVYSPVRAEAAALLGELAPVGLGHVFFGNSGTEANETALKLARKWTGKSGVIAMQQGFHGRTLGSLATTHKQMYRAPYAEVLPETHFVPFGDAEAVKATLAFSADIAAVIMEPIQSMAGMTTAPKAFFQEVRAACDAHGVALIFDEVQTGVGRTGTFSISDQLGVTPDLITMAKSLGNGVPVGATFVSDAIAATVEYGDQGSTFGGGMLAMAAVQATAQTIVDEALMDRAPQIFARIKAAVEPLGVSVRGAGCLIGLVLDGPAQPVIKALRVRHILTGGAGDPHVIRLMPPLNTPDDAIDAFVAGLSAALQEVSLEAAVA